ncbi:sensor histidine kinase (plasmid) [Rhizobium lusitanum]|uniref:sensor histidine kinase n=1 Tax=Rhizobium lusitanum TaxID=293958 RepID=UPI001619CBDB|nr:sensor histidine kinase [Rhizobium lusitanum]QND45350.1 sensor histidine kinase [Rhizobium lusitanum]
MTILPTLQPEGGLNLALAVVASSSAPLLLLDGDLMVIAASASFYHEFQIEPVKMTNRQLSTLGNGEWNVRQLSSLLQATAAGAAHVDAYEMDLNRDGQTPRRLVLNAQKLDYGDPEHIRLLLSVSDVTDARLAEKLKDDLLREKAILLQEVQHRVANSLQIIASILMQSARQVQSEETRTHLQSAHSRVMSIAAVQQQLAASRLGDVLLRPYFEQLCKSLGASMIQDAKALSIEVNVDDSKTKANVSVSLGLIVTELVINALKHAFPGHRSGKIIVDYHSNDTQWSMSVSDDGVGIRADPAGSKPGLGTGIVEAMAKQLDAEFTISDAKPGTKVSIVHM